MSATNRRSQRLANREAEVEIIDPVKADMPKKKANGIKKAAKSLATTTTTTTTKPATAKKGKPAKVIEVTKLEKTSKPAKIVKAEKKIKPTKATKAVGAVKADKVIEKASNAAVASIDNTKQVKKDKKEPVVIDLNELEEGDAFPSEFSVVNQDDKNIKLSDIITKNHIVVIFAYPKASTPGCTRQAQGFRDLYEKLHGDFGAVVYGLSADTPKAQTNFKTKQGLPYDLISDGQKKLIDLFGIRKVPSGIIRSHFIFVDGVLRSKMVKISPETSFKSALEDVEKYH